MADTPLLGPDGSQAGSVELSPTLFGAPARPGLLHQAAIAQAAGRRVGTVDTKTRGEVSGGGKKPWRQKGTGRARQGSRRAPQWTGGGIVFGPHPRDYELKVNAKVRRAALRGALTAKAEEGALRVVEGFGMTEIGTKTALACLAAWKAEGKVLVVLAARDLIVEHSLRNLREARVVLADSLNLLDVLEADTLVFTRDALARATEVYA